jgi:protein TonB
MALGIAGSVIAHAAAVVGLHTLIGDGRTPVVERADTQFARGEPIRIRLVEPDMPDVSPEPTNADRDIEMTSVADLGPLVPDPAPVESVPADPRPIEVREPLTEVVPTVSEHDIRPLTIAPQPPPPDWCAKLIQSVAKAVDMFEKLPPSTVSRPALRPVAESPAAAPVRQPRTQPSEAAPPKPDVQAQVATPASDPRNAGVEKGAESIRLPRPDYPSRAIRRGIEGTVLVEVEVLPDGTVGDVELHQSSGHRLLDDAALKAAREGRFRPATRDGKPVASRVIVPFEFYLK